MSSMEALKEINGLEEIFVNKQEPHIYFLTRNNEVVYVGQSERPIGSRILDHARENKKEFDCAYALRVEEKDSLSIVEGFFINKLSPVYNKVLPCTAEVCGYSELEKVLVDWRNGKLRNKESKIKAVKQKITEYVQEHASELPEWKKKYYEWKRAKNERWVTVSERLPDGDHKVKIHSIEPWDPPDTWRYTGDMLQVYFLGGEFGNQSATMLFNLPDNCVVGKNTKLGKLARAVFDEEQFKRPFDYYNDLLGKEVMVNIETQYVNSHMSLPKVTRFWGVNEVQLTKSEKIKRTLQKARKNTVEILPKRKKIDLNRVRAKVS